MPSLPTGLLARDRSVRLRKLDETARARDARVGDGIRVQVQVFQMRQVLEAANISTPIDPKLFSASSRCVRPAKMTRLGQCLDTVGPDTATVQIPGPVKYAPIRCPGQNPAAFRTQGFRANIEMLEIGEMWDAKEPAT